MAPHLRRAGCRFCASLAGQGTEWPALTAVKRSCARNSEGGGALDLREGRLVGKPRPRSGWGFPGPLLCEDGLGVLGLVPKLRASLLGLLVSSPRGRTDSRPGPRSRSPALPMTSWCFCAAHLKMGREVSCSNQRRSDRCSQEFCKDVEVTVVGSTGRHGSMDLRRRKHPAWGLRRGRSLGAATPALPPPRPCLFTHTLSLPHRVGGRSLIPPSGTRQDEGHQVSRWVNNCVPSASWAAPLPSSWTTCLVSTLGSHQADRPPQERWPCLHVLELSAHEPSSAIPHEDRSCRAWPGPRLE